MISEASTKSRAENCQTKATKYSTKQKSTKFWKMKRIELEKKRDQVTKYRDTTD